MPRLPLLLAASLLLPACRNSDKNDGVDTGRFPDCQTWYIDADGDGYGSDAYTQTNCDRPDGYVDNDDDCDDLDADLNPESTWYADNDGDTWGDPDNSTVSCARPEGYVIDNNDCDDTDPLVNPDTLWFRDNDGDGYGYAGIYEFGCEQPAGHAPNALDCDDNDAAINPDADEVCDGRDNDCDGGFDVDAVDAPSWYADDDADEHGDPEASVDDCDQPEGYVASDGDCDDADPLINPDADEICNDGVDNDCDGGFDHCTQSVTDADTLFIGESGDDGAGGAIAPAGDVNGDGYQDLWIGAYLEDSTGSDNGAAYLIHGPITDAEISLSDYDAKLVSDDRDVSAAHIVGGMDLNEDGTPDVAVSAAERVSGESAGATFLYFGPVQGLRSHHLHADAAIYGDNSWHRLGNASVGSDDATGDGSVDLILGAPYYPTGATNTSTGAVYLVPGPFDFEEYEVADAAALVMTGESYTDIVGNNVAAVDVTGDGVDDVLVGADLQDEGGSEAGAVYIVYNGARGTMSLGDADQKLLGLAAGDNTGQTVAPAGDHNGDGVEDFLVGAGGSDAAASNAGAVYLVDGASPDLSNPLALFLGESIGDNLGNHAASEGDLDGDGQLDLLLSANGEGLLDEGAVYLFFGPVVGTVSAGDANARFDGESADDAMGGRAAFVPDLGGTGDGLDDIVIGAAGNDRGGSESGAAYLILGVGL